MSTAVEEVTETEETDKGSEHVYLDNMKLVELSNIDFPEEWAQRALMPGAYESKELEQAAYDAAIAKLAQSIMTTGLLNPITVVLKESGRYKVVAGRNRINAYKSLGRTAIECRVFEEGEGFNGRIAFLVENLFRVSLNKSESYAAMSEWQEAYYAANPSARPGVAAAARARQAVAEKKAAAEGKPIAKPAVEEKPAEPVPSFTEHVAEATGMSQRTVQRIVKRAKGFSPEELEAMDKAGVTAADQEKMLTVKDKVARSEAVSLAVSGMAVDNAIARANTPKADKAGKKEKVVVEKDLSDEEWLARFCDKCRSRLKFQAAFDAAAILYRKTRAARDQFVKTIRPSVGKAKTLEFNPYIGMLSRICNVEHPDHWLACGTCDGTGQDAEQQGKCSDCKGAAYKVKFQEPKRK